MPRMTIIAHRGWPAKFPENTLLSFREAIALGVDAIEFDVHLTKDGQLVVIHDGDVSRTTNGKGNVSKLTLKALRALDAGQGERIPTLREVLELGKGKVAFHLEIKAPGTEKKVITLVEDEGVMDTTYFSSFSHPTMGNIKALRPAAKVATLETQTDISSEAKQQRVAKQFTQHAQKVQAIASHIHFLNVTPVIVNYLHEHGLQVNVWTVDSEILAEELMQMSVDGIFTNRADALLNFIKKGQKR